MIQIGITGGIGSGKSTVCKIFTSLGIPILDADALAKELIVNDTELVRLMIQNFGEQTYLEDGTYNRAYIANVVFNDPLKLTKLNSLVHPKVIAFTKVWASNHKHLPYIIKEAALMFESGSYLHNDFNMVVESPLEIRIKRICSRDSVSEDNALKRINSQLSDVERREKADLIIINDDKNSLIQQVTSIHHNILTKNDPR